MNDEVLKYLITESDRSILNKFRPDKCIDILDDMLSSASIAHKTEVTKDDVDVSIQTYLGNKILKDTYTLHYPSLEKYKWLYFNHLLDEQPLLKLKYHGISEGLEDLVTDCREIFNIGHEAVLSLDLSGYKDSFMLTSLIGAPPGYIGYEDEGILSKHILAYPSSILVLKNFHEASGNVSSFLLNCIRNGYYTDQKSRLIQLKHVIVIVEGIQEKKLIGFSEKLLEEDALFDEVISSEKNTTANLNYIYEKALSRLNYEISFDFDINSSNKRKVNKYLYEFTKANDKGKYEIHKEDILDNWL